jgi:hypothetical protein
MELIVECYSGHTYAQEPRAFTWHGERHVVQAVERVWRTPEGPHFLVRTEDGGFFELAYDEAEDVWSARERSINHVSCLEFKTHSKEDQR